ncbi:MAG: histidine phosphatase family protein [Chloroflexales bacterium]|nr:histidine phosphatase family protein [Chloroflexales bacterium]
MTHLYLIRHGESWPNVRPIIGGMKGDEGLTPLGISQAERLRDRLAATREIPADVLIASTLPRARQTAQIIAPALRLPITLDDEVQELRMGEADGMSHEAFDQTFGRPDFQRQPTRPVAPGGESWSSFMLRVATNLERIAAQHAGKHVAIVCHGGVIDGSLIYFFGLDGLRLPRVRFYTRNTSITYWQLIESDAASNQLASPRWRLEYYNDATHLREVGARESISWDELAEPESGSDTPAVPLPTEEPQG